jgi:hypothetical protein
MFEEIVDSRATKNLEFYSLQSAGHDFLITAAIIDATAIIKYELLRLPTNKLKTI